MFRKSLFRTRKTSCFLFTLTAMMIMSTFVAPASSISANPCAACHSQYYEHLDIRERDSGNQLPQSINVGENRTVTVVVENSANTNQNTIMYDVVLTLRSQDGHFSVKQQTYVIGNLQWGKTKNATWEITGVSEGTDGLLIAATSKNGHQALTFSDSYVPAPVIAVYEALVPELPKASILIAFILISAFLAVLIKKKVA